MPRIVSPTCANVHCCLRRGLALACVVAMGSCGKDISPSAAREELLCALASQRLEGHLWDLQAAPRCGHDRGRPPSEERPRLQAAVRAVLASPRNTVEAARERALLEIATGRLTSAIADLTATTRLTPDDPRPWNDLAVVLLARARAAPEDACHDQVLALEAAGRAVRLMPASSAALFNLALALERLGLDAESARARRTYLALPGSAPERTTAEQRAQQVATQDDEAPPRSTAAVAPEGRGTTAAACLTLTAAAPETARTWAMEDLLGKWADAMLAGDPTLAAAYLGTARRIGWLLAARHGDRTVADAVHAAAHRAAAAPADPLVAGYAAYHQGILAERSDDYAAADAAFAHAVQALRLSGSPVARLALLERGACAYYRLDYGASLDLLRQATAGLDAADYPAIAARSRWLAGLDHLVQRDLPLALLDHRSAAAAFERLGERQHAAFLHFLVAADLADLGERRLAWQERGRALAARGELDDIRRVHSVLWEAAHAAMDEDAGEAALFFVRELLDDPRLYRLPAALAEVVAYRGLLEQRLGSFDRARTSLRRARTYAAAVGDPAFRRRIAADIERYDSEATLAVNRRGAAAGLAQALAFFQRAGFAEDELELRRELAQAYEQDGSHGLASAELRRGLAAYLSTRQTLASDIAKQHYARAAEGLLGDLLRVDGHELRSPIAALEALESTRARSLLDFTPSLAATDLPTAVAPLALAEIQRRLDRHTALVEYACDGPDLFIGVVTATEVSLERVRTGGGCAHFATPARTADSDSYLRFLGDAYDLTLRPIVPHLRGITSLVFIPDSRLAALPYAALWDRDSRTFLVSRFDIQVAPSATFYLSAGARLGVGALAPPGILLVRGDAFDRVLFSDLAPLASGEAAAMARAGLHLDLLAGSAATRAAVLRRLDEQPLLCFSAHALHRPDHPSHSGILLAPDRDDGVLTADDLQKVRLRRVRLVILGACNTIAAGEAGAEGISGIARAFLAAGAPAVLATLAAVDDAAASRFLSAFFRRLAARRPFAAALRDTQLAAIAHPAAEPRDALAWAQFELIGGHP